MLLHYGNVLSAVPVAMKEIYKTMCHTLQATKYEDHCWRICGDLKVFGLLMGLQSGFTIFPCFLCLWDSRDTKEHYKVKKWLGREKFTPAQNNVKFKSLVDQHNVFPPPLQFKLGLMKNFVKAMDKNGEGFKHLRTVFSGLSGAKLKEGVFVGPQIRKVTATKILIQIKYNGT